MVCFWVPQSWAFGLAQLRRSLKHFETGWFRVTVHPISGSPCDWSFWVFFSTESLGKPSWHLTEADDFVRAEAGSLGSRALLRYTCSFDSFELWRVILSIKQMLLSDNLPGRCFGFQALCCGADLRDSWLQKNLAGWELLWSVIIHVHPMQDGT